MSHNAKKYCDASNFGATNFCYVLNQFFDLFQNVLECIFLFIYLFSFVSFSYFSTKTYLVDNC